MTPEKWHDTENVEPQDQEIWIVRLACGRLRAGRWLEQLQTWIDRQGDDLRHCDIDAVGLPS